MHNQDCGTKGDKGSQFRHRGRPSNPAINHHQSSASVARHYAGVKSSTSCCKARSWSYSRAPKVSSIVRMATVTSRGGRAMLLRQPIDEFADFGHCLCAILLELGETL
jgi:hypothetical protein